MYRLDWIEQLKLRLAAPPRRDRIGQVSPVVWHMGWTSFLTDISAEMVNSALPGYLVLYLHLSPLEYGAIDGVYNGLAVALLSLAAGIVADRSRRPKLVSVAGYGLSAICKLLLLATGTAWAWILAIVWLDRTGKSIRTAPRDAIISLNSSPALMASSFALHRALDACGSLLGPLVTFALLWPVPTKYAHVWLVSFAFAVHGMAVLWFRVPEAPKSVPPGTGSRPTRQTFKGLLTGRLLALSVAALLLSAMSISDGFIYLLLQKQGGPGALYFPLFYVVTASFYVLLSVPAGRIADRFGRVPVFIAGYGALGLLYLVLLRSSEVGLGTVGLALGLLGLFYSATEGVLTAMASVVIPNASRATGIALVATLAGVGKVISSIAFGWMWGTFGALPSVAVFSAGLAAAIVVGVVLLRTSASRVSA
jgi:MFS family permease